MVQVLAGAKGSGKTKQIINNANAVVGKSKGDIVFISVTDRYRAEISSEIKFIDINKENIAGKDMLAGFLKGIIAANYDIEYIFIDGILKAINANANDEAFKQIFNAINDLGKESGAKFFITLSCEKENVPGFVTEYLV